MTWGPHHTCRVILEDVLEGWTSDAEKQRRDVNQLSEIETQSEVYVGAGFVELSPQRQDLLYSYQLSTSNPLVLGTNVFYVAGCTDYERRSHQIHRALQKNGVLDEDGRVDTTKIGPKFIHQLAFVDQMSQKNIVNVLFFWEEEVHRLNKLESEEAELTSLISAAENAQSPEGDEPHAPLDPQKTQTLDQMRFARERVRMKKRQRPSQRRVDLEADQDTTVEDAFRARVNAPTYTNDTTGATASNMDGQRIPAQDLPPSYYAPQNTGRHWSVA